MAADQVEGPVGTVQVVVERNATYWKKDADGGAQLSGERELADEGGVAALEVVGDARLAADLHPAGEAVRHLARPAEPEAFALGQGLAERDPRMLANQHAIE